MSNVVDFQAWKDKKHTKSIHKIFGEALLPYLFTSDTNNVTYTITVDGEDYCIENLLFDDNLLDPK